MERLTRWLPWVISVTTLLIVCSTVYFLASVIATQREAMERAEARTEMLLEEVRAPSGGSPRADLFERTRNIERLLEQHIAEETS